MGRDAECKGCGDELETSQIVDFISVHDHFPTG